MAGSYVGLITALVTAARLVEDPFALNMSAFVMTLPSSLLAVPVDGVIYLASDGAESVFGLGPGWSDIVADTGFAVVLFLAAVANVALAPRIWGKWPAGP